MKLIAVEKISEELLPGTGFEIPDHDLASAHTLITAGLAREDTSEVAATSAEPAAAPAEPASTGRRAYHRRDLKAEP